MVAFGGVLSGKLLTAVLADVVAGPFCLADQVEFLVKFPAHR